MSGAWVSGAEGKLQGWRREEGAGTPRKHPEAGEQPTGDKEKWDQMVRVKGGPAGLGVTEAPWVTSTRSQ